MDQIKIGKFIQEKRKEKYSFIFAFKTKIL